MSGLHAAKSLPRGTGLKILCGELSNAERTPSLVHEFVAHEPDFKSIFSAIALLIEVKKRNYVSQP